MMLKDLIKKECIREKIEIFKSLNRENEKR